MRETGLDFGVLGPLLMTVDGSPVPLGPPKQRAVVATLLMSRNRPVSIDTLIAAAWGESPAPAARTGLHSYVSNLRRILGDAGVDPRTVLTSAPPGYRLSARDSDCDLGRFVSAKVDGVRAAADGRFEEAGNHLSSALAEWRGQVLEDLRDFPFVGPFATALTEDRLEAATTHAEAEIACGRGPAVIAGLEALVADHPYREPLWAQLITAYYVGGRQSDALDAYRRLKTTLAEELGIDPGPAVGALHERILRQEPLDVGRAAQAAAVRTMAHFDSGTAPSTRHDARLRDTAGRRFPLHTSATRIGRLADNDVVLGDADVSRHHAVIIDTGTSFMIVDLRSANGVSVRGQRIQASTNLFDGDRITIGGHELIFEVL